MTKQNNKVRRPSFFIVFQRGKMVKFNFMHNQFIVDF